MNESGDLVAGEGEITGIREARPAPGVSHRLTLAFITGTALYIRLLHVFSYESAPSNDMAAFIRIAIDSFRLENLFKAESFSRFAPGYPLFLKPFYFLFEETTAARLVQAAQALLGAWTCVLVYRLARRLHSRRAGLIAATLTCFFGHFTLFTSHWMSENLFIPALLAGLLLLLRAAQKPAGLTFLRAGAGMGAAMMIRPPAACLAPAALWAAWVAAPDPRGRLRALLLFAAGACLLIVPWSVHNYVATGHLYLIAPYGPYLMAIGNAPEATGTTRDLVSPDDNYWESRDEFKRRVGEFIFGDPLSAIHIALRMKWRAFWSSAAPWPISTLNPRTFAGERYFPLMGWQPVLALGLVGLLIARHRKPAALTLLALASYVGFFMLLYGKVRYRLPAEAFFLAFAGVATVALADALPILKRFPARRWPAAVALALAAVLVQTEADAAVTRRSLRGSDRILAEAGRSLVLPDAELIHLFEPERIPVDRSRGRYVRLSFKAYRSGPPRVTPDNGWLVFMFYDRDGRWIHWQEVPRYSLEALPEGEWVDVRLKTQIPPAAAFVEPRIAPRKGSPDLLVVDAARLRQMRGNDLAGEFLSPALLRKE